jgi:SWI/SNF-related matrix-associated actin-dependent regulator 1 of chromatin subfamily A
MRLRPYQIEGVARCVERNQLLAFDPGLGKTATALLSVVDRDRVALVVPNLARAVWVSEIMKWTARRSFVELRGVQKLTARHVHFNASGALLEEHSATPEDLQREWLLMTHESARSWGALMVPEGSLSLSRADPSTVLPGLPRELDALIVDEVHRFGARDAQGTLGVLEAAKAASRVIILSGTPAKGGPHRLWAPLSMITPGQWGSYHDFIVRYAAAERDDYGLKPTGASNVEELAARLQDYALAYTRAQVARYLPRHTRQRLVVPLSGAAMRGLGPIIDSATKRLKARGELRGEDAWTSPEVVALRLALAELKIPAAVQLVGELLESGQKVVVWAWHRDVVKKLAVALAQAKINRYLCLTGETTDEGIVDRAVASWSAVDKPVALLATMGKLGEARDLTAACFQVFLEIDWLAETVNQAESRLVRLSQTHPVTTYLLGLELPFEQSLLDRVEARAGESDGLFGTQIAPALGELFGRVQMTDAEALAAFARSVA